MPTSEIKSANRGFRNALRFWSRTRLWFLIALVVITFLLGYVGFAEYYAALQVTQTPLDLAYLSAQLFILQSGAVPSPLPWTLELARYLALGLAFYTVVVTLARIFADQVYAMQLRRMHNHVVICGLGRKGWLLAQRFQDMGKTVVVVERDPENEFLPTCVERRMLVIQGNAGDMDLLMKARADRAQTLIAVTGDEAVNSAIALHARELCRNNPIEKLTCIVHVVDPVLCHLLKPQELADVTSAAGSDLRLTFFNVYLTGAEMMLDESSVLRVPAPHVLVVGAGRMGEALIVHLARKWLNQQPRPQKKLSVALIDRDARKRMDWLFGRYSDLEDGIELSALEMDVESAEFERGAFLWDARRQAVFTHIFICLAQDDLGLVTALSLQHQLREHRVEIILRLAQQQGLAQLLPDHSEQRTESAKVHIFPLYERTCQPDRALDTTLELFARAYNEYWRQRRLEQDRLTGKHEALPEWKELDETFRESSRREAQHIIQNLKAIHYGIGPRLHKERDAFVWRDEDVNELAIREHNRWKQERAAQGWVYAQERDNANKENPLLVEWDNLLPEEKERNRNAIRAISNMLASVGLGIYPLETSSGAQTNSTVIEPKSLN